MQWSPLIPWRSVTLTRNPMPVFLPSPHSPSPCNHSPTFSLYICLFWTFPVQYVVCFFFSMFPCPSMLYHVSVLYSFWLLSDIPLCGYYHICSPIHQWMNVVIQFLLSPVFGLSEVASLLKMSSLATFPLPSYGPCFSCFFVCLVIFLLEAGCFK